VTIVVRNGEVPGVGRVDVGIAGGRIVAVEPELDGDEVVDATGCTVAPGFVDLQCNGAGGIDLTTQPERVAEVAALLPRWGVTAWLPTVVTAAPDVRARAVEAITAAEVPDGAAAVLGVHLEGPFLAPGRTGAHDRRWVLDPVDEGWSRDGGVAVVTLAPERPGGLELLRALADRGVVVAVGHSDATAEEVGAAVDAGATLVTHLFNAMSPLHHRAPGVVGAALTDDRLRFGVIADGIHVDPAVVRLAWRAAGDRLVLVTDAVAPMGSATHAPGTGVRLPDGTLAGSDLSMDRAVRNLIAFAGCSAEEAIVAATATPAAAVGATDRGCVRPGAVADLVLLDADLGVVATVVRGVVRRW
jgi:N-acetylglucosamine-6-phosphate deacetylase